MALRVFFLLATSIALLTGTGCGRSQPPALKTRSPAEQKAVDSAQAFLAGKATDWGVPSQIRREDVEHVPGMKGEGVYVVTYATPRDEVKLVGDRAVVVDTKTGRVEFMPRD